MIEDTRIDTGNYQLIGVNGGRLVVMNPKREMSKSEALLHAAWLVALADESDDNADFKRVLDAVLSI